jgi:hypothetical protein
MNPNIHNFEKLKKSGEPYPFSLKATHLDENNKFLSLIQPDPKGKNSDLYEVAYTKDGTRLARIFQNGTKAGDLLHWDGTKWTPLVGPESDTLHVLGIKNNVLQWVETQDCPE